jgi:hypothetical protein
VQIGSPVSSAIYKPGDNVNVSVTVNTGLPLTKVEIFLDNVSQKVFTTGPYQMTISLPAAIAQGNHTITAIATDSLKQEGRGEVTFSVQKSGATPTPTPGPTKPPTPTPSPIKTPTPKPTVPVIPTLEKWFKKNKS